MRYIDWIPFQRPKISDRCPPDLRAKVFEENKDLLLKYAKMTDTEVSAEMTKGRCDAPKGKFGPCVGLKEPPWLATGETEGQWWDRILQNCQTGVS